ncbi:MAG: hypothetical protein RL272_1126 [Candidatus Parcubacteria bacterium]
MTLIAKPLKVLLVNPETPPSYWGFQESTWFVGARAAHVPLPLITLAGLLPAEWDLKLVDMNVERLRDQEIAAADAVLITGMIVQRASLEKVLGRCAALGAATVVGGPFASSAPDAPELAQATSLVIGEAEDPAIAASLASDIASGALKKRYVAAGQPDMRRSPVPRYALLRKKAYCAMAIQVSRGCPHHCEFCNVRMLFGRRPRYKAPEQVVAELQAVFDIGYRGNLFFVDDNFIGDVKAARAILQAISAWQDAHGRPFLFYTEADIRLAEQESLVDLMVEAGFFAVFTGFESPSEEALKEAEKTQNLKIDAPTAVRRLRQKGLLVYGGFIVGFDADGPEIIGRTAAFIEDCRIDFAMAGMLTAIPGTPLEKRLETEGRLLHASDGDAFGPTNIMPKRMSRLELLSGYRELLEKLYDPRRFFDRAFAALKEWKPVARRRVTLREYLAVPRSIIRQGIFSRYSLQYWRFMLRTLFREPRKIARAFATAISGHHFFRYTRRVVLPRLRSAELALLAEQAGKPSVA